MRGSSTALRNLCLLGGRFNVHFHTGPGCVYQRAVVERAKAAHVLPYLGPRKTRRCFATDATGDAATDPDEVAYKVCERCQIRRDIRKKWQRGTESLIHVEHPGSAALVHQRCASRPFCPDSREAGCQRTVFGRYMARIRAELSYHCYLLITKHCMYI